MDRLLSTREAAELLGIKPGTLHTWRCLHRGPDFIRLGSRKIAYRPKDLETFMAAGWVETSAADRKQHPAEQTTAN